jgi:hypothetical protein
MTASRATSDSARQKKIRLAVGNKQDRWDKRHVATRNRAEQAEQAQEATSYLLILRKRHPSQPIVEVHLITGDVQLGKHPIRTATSSYGVP